MYIHMHTTMPFPGSSCHIRTYDDVEGLDMWRLAGMTKKTVALGLICFWHMIIRTGRVASGSNC